MASDIIRLSVPAQAGYARSVRMLASTLAVVDGFSVDDVEDVRMASEEGFVYACATHPATCDITFEIGSGEVAIDFGLGEDDPTPLGIDGQSVDDLDLVELLLSAVCDDFSVVEGDGGATLHLVKRAGHVE